AVPSPVLRQKKPARRSLRDRMEGIADDGLHDLGKQIVGEAAEQVRDERGTLLAVLDRLQRNPEASTRDEHLCKRISGRMTATDDPANGALAADRRDFGRASAA